MRQQALEAATAESNRLRVAGAMRDSATADSGKNARHEPDANPQGDLALRDAISRLAADVARLNGASENPLLLHPRPGKVGLPWICARPLLSGARHGGGDG